ncbi:MAG: hypothetical protein OEU99_17290, partial [Nitrospira sp.]|nr:hypothetical protein [Nitrospira sp.]
QTVSQIGRKSATSDRPLRPCVAGLRWVAGFTRNRRPDSAEYAPGRRKCRRSISLTISTFPDTKQLGTTTADQMSKLP